MSGAVPGVGVVGAGRMGAVHARIVAESPGADLRVVVDPDERTGRAVAGRWGATWVPTVEAALHDPATTAYVVAVPDRLHVDVAVALLGEGRHLLLEKPLAHTGEGALRIAAAARRSAGRLEVGHVLRHDARYRLAAATVADGGIGEPVHLRASRIVPRDVGVANAGRSPIATYQGVHDIDLVAWVSGHAITEVCAITAAKVLPALGVAGDDVALVLCRLANGAAAVLEISWALPSAAPAGLSSRLEVYGTDGALHLDGGDLGLTVLRGDRVSLPDTMLGAEVGGRLSGALVRQFAHFLAVAAGAAEPVVPLDDAVASAHVLDAVEGSLARHGWATVASVPP